MTSFLASLQIVFLAAWGVSFLVGHPFAGWIAFLPLECLVFVAVMFWTLFILGIRKMG